MQTSFLASFLFALKVGEMTGQPKRAFLPVCQHFSQNFHLSLACLDLARCLFRQQSLWVSTPQAPNPHSIWHSFKALRTSRGSSSMSLSPPNAPSHLSTLSLKGTQLPSPPSTPFIDVFLVSLTVTNSLYSEWLTSRNLTTDAVGDVWKLGPLFTVGGVQTSTGIVEICMELTQSIKNKWAI